MWADHVTISTHAGTVLGDALVTAPNGVFVGHIALCELPATVRERFDAFEETVTDQVFSLLDEAAAAISDLGLRGRFADGAERPLANVQLYPSTGLLSFQIATEARSKPEHASA